jgi:hypothetical protein
MPPDHWLVHRKKQGFRGPNCLCPLLRTTNEESSLTEAQIVLKESGDHIGQYIAECPNGRCEYFGELPVACVALIVYEILKKIVPLDQKYALYGIPVKRYAPRSKLFLRGENRSAR